MRNFFLARMFLLKFPTKIKSIVMLSIMLGVAIFAQSCAPLNGNVQLFKVTDDGRLAGPWYIENSNSIYDKYSSYGNLVDNTGNNKPVDNIISRTFDESVYDTEYKDTFTIYFDQAFFKYLQDHYDSSEVVVIFTFQEGDDDENKIVKIVGPMKRVSDGTMSHWLNKVSYGPTRLTKEYLSVQIDVIEMDTEENERNSSFINFIGSAAETFSLANPVTAGEIKVAKEIASTLMKLNGNDHVFTYRFDVVPAEASRVNGKFFTSKGIPLMEGDYVLIKQEVVCALCRYFNKSVVALSAGNPTPSTMGDILISMPIDILMLPVVALRRNFTDVPDIGAMSKLFYNESGVGVFDKYRLSGPKVNEHEIYFDDSYKTLVMKNVCTARDTKCLEDFNAKLPVTGCMDGVKWEEWTNKIKAYAGDKSGKVRWFEQDVAVFTSSANEMKGAKINGTSLTIFGRDLFVEDLQQGKTLENLRAKLNSCDESSVSSMLGNTSMASFLKTDLDQFGRLRWWLREQINEVKLKGRKMHPYVNKTWVAFTIEQGGDARYSSFRKTLSEAEKKIVEAIKDDGNRKALGESKVVDAITVLEAAKIKEKSLASAIDFKLVQPSAPIPAANTKPLKVEINYSGNIEKDSLKVYALESGMQGAEGVVEWSSVTLKSISANMIKDMSINSAYFEFSNGKSLMPGNYRFFVEYARKGASKKYSESFEFEVK